jgi:predicted dehydrogenase
MNVLVIGYGSIGARHARLLTERGCNTAIASARPVDFPTRFADLTRALDTHRPEYVVIANETHLHHDTLSKLRRLGYNGKTLVEKPVFHRYLTVEPPVQTTFVAYNLRFHPILQRLRALLRSEQALSVQVYAGQYLPDWRPATDYRSCYSASAERGGGVIRDLSHELDYVTWMFGCWERVSALGGQLSSLQVSSDDVFALLLVTRACPIVTVHLNYVDRAGRRSIIVNTNHHTFAADLVAGTLTIDRDVEVIATERDNTYRSLHEAALIGNETDLCSLAEGLETMRLIDAAEQAALHRKWVDR